VFDTLFVDHDTPYYTPNPGANCWYNQKYQDNLTDTNKEANVVTFAHKGVDEGAQRGTKNVEDNDQDSQCWVNGINPLFNAHIYIIYKL
jgi:hypothetical protein